jgi:N-acetylglucosamine-6-phosphate deacetylase
VTDLVHQVSGRLLLGTDLIPGTVVIEDGKIAEVRRQPGTTTLDDEMGDAAIIAPGFIDLQVNGGFGYEVGEDPEGIRGLARRLPETGVTAFLPTVVTATPEFYRRAYQAFDEAKNTVGARPLGLHVEGPFISVERSGAHRRDLIRHADPALIHQLLQGDALRLLTLAPERPGALDWIRRAREQDIVVSLGHTNASIDDFESGVDAGATMATHLFNAMSSFQHREPNAIGGALVDDRVTVGLIADGVHSHPASLELAVRSKGSHRIALVTDMVAAAGMQAGSHQLGGRPLLLEGNAVRLEDGTLAGSALTMDQAVRNVVNWTSASTQDVLSMASTVPARLLGLGAIGEIRAGFAADLVLLDAQLRVQATMIRGAWAYRKQEI